MREQPSSPGKKKKFRVELSPVGLFLSSLGLVFILGWIFVLGVMVGRGFVPEGVKSIGQMTDQLSRLITILARDREQGADRNAAMEQQTKLEFYDYLSRSDPEPEKGTAKLEIPRASAVPKASEPKDDGAVEIPKAEESGWAVQVASLDNESKAIKLVEKLKRLGYPAFTYKTVVKGAVFHRVRCGPFKARVDAEAAKRSLLEKEKIDAFLTMIGQ
ncbi:MAG: SPOR domain-containing protein [Desulfatiglandaceae bacterium]